MWVSFMIDIEDLLVKPGCMHALFSPRSALQKQNSVY